MKLRRRLTEAWVRWASPPSYFEMSDEDLQRAKEELAQRSMRHMAQVIRGRARLTAYTQPQMQLAGFLERAGYEVELEVPFGPYRVDCYLPDYHLAFEADGPLHVAERDRKRDAWLLTHCYLPVARLTCEEIMGRGLCEA